MGLEVPQVINTARPTADAYKSIMGVLLPDVVGAGVNVRNLIVLAPGILATEDDLLSFLVPNGSQVQTPIAGRPLGGPEVGDGDGV